VVDRVTLTIGTGYTFMYPTDDGDPDTPITSWTPYELAGPGNWVTVPIYASHCAPLSQLVFEVRFPRCQGDMGPCGCEPMYPYSGYAGLEYMAGTEKWNAYDPVDNPGGRVYANGPFDRPDWVNIEYGVAEDENASWGRVIVYIDSPSGAAVVKEGSGVIMWLMFRVCDSLTTEPESLDTMPLVPDVIYATGTDGLEIGHDEVSGVVYADQCNWLLDVDSNGRVEAETDGVTLYRALKYGHLTEYDNLCICPVVPILPPEYAAAAGEYLPCDYFIVEYVRGLLSLVGLNVDGESDGIPDAIGGSDVSASRDGVYIYRNLAGFPLYIYPTYTPPGPYSVFVSPSVPDMASRSDVNVTVPAGHTDHTASPATEDAINAQIDLRKVMFCDWMVGGKVGGKTDAASPQLFDVEMPCWWILDLGMNGDVDKTPTYKTLPLPQTPWTEPCGYTDGGEPGSGY
jgi:hypothetical protein